MVEKHIIVYSLKNPHFVNICYSFALFFQEVHTLKSMLLQLSAPLMERLAHAAVDRNTTKAALVRLAIEAYLSREHRENKEPYKTCEFYRPGRVLGCRFPLWREKKDLYEEKCDDCRYAEARLFYGPEEPPPEEVNTDGHNDTSSTA